MVRKQPAAHVRQSFLHGALLLTAGVLLVKGDRRAVQDPAFHRDHGGRHGVFQHSVQLFTT